MRPMLFLIAAVGGLVLSLCSQPIQGALVGQWTYNDGV